MTNLISKSIKEVKQDVGIYFRAQQFEDAFKDIENEGYVGQFSAAWRYMFMRSFERNVDLIFNLVACNYKKDKRLTIQIHEHFYSQYANWFVDDEKGVYYTLEDAKKSLHKQLVNNVENFFMRYKNSYMINAIQKKEKTFMKSFCLKTKLGKKIQYILDRMQKLRDCSIDQLFNVEVLTDYQNNEQQVLLPNNWNELKNKSEFEGAIVKNDKVMNAKMYVFKMYLNKENNSMVINFEVDNNLPIANFQYYVLNESKTDYCFEEKVFFKNQEAIKDLQKDLQKRLVELQDKLVELPVEV